MRIERRLLKFITRTNWVLFAMVVVGGFILGMTRLWTLLVNNSVQLLVGIKMVMTMEHGTNIIVHHQLVNC